MEGWIDEADGVFRGGGVKGLGLAGALLAFAEHPRKPIRRWVNCAGASAGAIIAAYLAVKDDEAVAGLAELLNSKDFAEFRDYPRNSLLLGGVPNFVRRRGLARGHAFESWFDEVLGKATFADVRGKDGKSQLALVAVDVTERRLLVLPDDLPLYRLPGADRAIDPDAFPISAAARMSMAIPYFFEPVSLVRDTVRCVDPGSTDFERDAVVDRTALLAANSKADHQGRRSRALRRGREPADFAHHRWGHAVELPRVDL